MKIKVHSALFFLLALGAAAPPEVASKAADQVIDGNEVIRKTIAAHFVGNRNMMPRSLTLRGDGTAFGFPANFELHANAAGAQSISVETIQYSLFRAIGGDKGWEKQSWQNLGGTTGSDYREIDPRIHSRSRPFYLFALLGYLNDPEACALPGDTMGRDDVYIVVCRSSQGTESYHIRKSDFLPVARAYAGTYSEGARTIEETYGDYRNVGNMRLPFSIAYPDPELPRLTLKVRVRGYETSRDLKGEQFAQPESMQSGEPFEATLKTVPFHVYKEADWIQGAGEWDQNGRWATTFGPTETWTFDMMVDEKFGRWLEPSSAVVTFYARGKALKTITFSKATLDMVRRRDVSRYAGFAGIMVFRHHFTEPADLDVDAMSYRLKLLAPDGSEVVAESNVPVSRYKQKTALMFPVKGDFMIVSGHDWDEINHKDEWQQWGAYDIIPLGEGYRLRTSEAEFGTPEFNASFPAFGREILAPAEGRVVYARGGVPDTLPDDFWEKMDLPRDVWALPGNVIIIDHGHDEFSFFAHLQNESIKVKVGDKVEKGQVIALLGASNGGVPHLHYQLMSGPVLLRSDGLPSEFENIRESDPEGRKIRSPKSGRYLTAE